MLEARGIVCGYGSVPVIHGLDITVGDGESVAVLGPNGAGKSILMKALAGSLPLHSGSIVWDGHDISEWPPWRVARAGIGYVPQDNNVFGDLSVRENLALSAAATGDGRQLVEEYAHRFPVLTQRAAQRAGNLSGGERQMLALASALVMAPRLLLLDEPTSGLAPLVLEEVCRIIASVIEHGIAVVWVVQQNPERVLEIVDRAKVMAGGEFVGDYSRDDLRKPHIVEHLVNPQFSDAPASREPQLP